MSAIQLEIFGTFASIVIAISLMMKNVKWLRVVNLAGSVLFALYGLGIGSIPVLVVNTLIVFIDGWYIVKAKRTQANFSLLHAGAEDEYLQAFLLYYKKDIARYAPDFSLEGCDSPEAVFVLRDLVPASLVIYKRRSEGGIDLLLDYATPAYRDYQNAEFFFSVAAKDIAKGGEARYYERSGTRAHIAYLKRLGFLPSDKPVSLPGAGLEYVKTVRS